MKLKSGPTFWSRAAHDLRAYPSLSKNVTCDIAVVGGGIIGALVAHELSKQGLSIVVLDKGRIGHGSTSASTALLLYELDVHLVDLVRKLGTRSALRVYQLSLRAIGRLGRLSRSVGIPSAFRKKRSLYVALSRKDAGPLRAEYALRRRHKFRVRFLEPGELRASFGIRAFGAIVSEDAGEVDPYRLTRVLVRDARRCGARVFERTRVTSIFPGVGGSVLETAGGVVRAEHVVVATGYESQQFMSRKIVSLKSSYVIVSQRVPNLSKHWLHTHLFWETRRPYLYARTTSDQRIVVGGLDEDVVDDKQRDALIPAKARLLRKMFLRLVPDVPFEIAYAWAGTFGETKDGMGYVGTPSDRTGAYFALGFGGNGITFGILAADMITKSILGKRCPDASLFAFDRAS